MNPDRQIGQIVVCTIVVLGFVSVLLLLLMRPQRIDDAMLSLLTLLLGALSAKFGDVVQYYIGSSQGSRSKDQALSDIAATSSAAASTAVTDAAAAVGAAQKAPAPLAGTGTGG